LEEPGIFPQLQNCPQLPFREGKVNIDLTNYLKIVK